MQRRLLALVLALPALGGCATKRDLRDLRTEMDSLRSSQEAMLKEIQRQNEMILDSLSIKDVRLRGELSNQMVQMERQLIRIQELTGQGQQRLAELRRELREREEAIRAAAAASATPAGGAAGDPGELFSAAQEALQRGSHATARAGFEEFLRFFPRDARAAEAQLGIGESYEKAKEPQQAVDAYQRVLELYPDAPAAATALHRAAQVELERGNRDRARTLLNQLVAAYPRSPEAALAKQQLPKLRR